MNTQKMLREMTATLKSMTVPDLNEGRLNEQQSTRFLQEVEDSGVALSEARQIPMNRDRVAIDRIAMSERVLVAGSDAAGNRRTFGANDRRRPNFKTNHLVAKELGAVFPLSDDVLARNIEEGTLEDTLISLAGQAAGRDMEELFYLGDQAIPYASDPVLNQINGWAKKSPNRIFGHGTGHTSGSPVVGAFDESVSTGRIEDQFPANMFVALIEAIDQKYLRDEAQWRFHVTRPVMRRYQQLLANNGLINEVLSPGPVTWEGIPVVTVPLLSRARDTSAFTNAPGRVASLQMPDNMVYGLFRNIRIEPRREPLDRSTEFILTFEADCHYENEEASAVAYVDRIKPA